MRHLSRRTLQFTIAGMALVLAATIGFGFGSVASQAASSDQSGTAINQVVVHPLTAFSGPINQQWNDGQPFLLPGTTMTITVPNRQHDFFTITEEGLAGISCTSTHGVFVSATPLLESSSGSVIPFFAGQTAPVTPVLDPGTYSLGLSAVCTPPDPVNDPSATYQIPNGDFIVTRVK